MEVGILSCAAGSTTGTIFASSKSLYCQFQGPGHLELYRGRIDRFGLDLGSTGKTAIAWAVLAPTANPPPRSLAGTYGGIGAEATVGYGIGANAPDRRLAPWLYPAALECASPDRPQYRGGRPVAGAQRRLKPLAEEGSAQRQRCAGR